MNKQIEAWWNSRNDATKEAIYRMVAPPIFGTSPVTISPEQFSEYPVIFCNDHPILICIGLSEVEVQNEITRLENALLDRIRKDHWFNGHSVSEEQLALYSAECPLNYHVHKVPFIDSPTPIDPSNR